jgi:hypothetical protein
MHEMMMCTKTPVIDETPELADIKVGVTDMQVGVTDLKAGVTDLKADVTDLKAHVMILSLKIDAVESLLTDQYGAGSVRDVICLSDGSAEGTYPSDVFINPVCRQFVGDPDGAYQEPIHELKNILRRSKLPKGKPRWK